MKYRPHLAAQEGAIKFERMVRASAAIAALAAGLTAARSITSLHKYSDRAVRL